MNQTIKFIYNLPFFYHHHPYRTNTGSLPVSRFKINRCKFVHFFQDDIFFPVGKVNSQVVPFPKAETSPICPPRFLTILSQSGSPNPDL